MQIFGQSEYVICGDYDQIGAVAIKKTNKAHLLRMNISQEINQKYAELENRAGEAILRYMDQLNKPS